LNQTQPFDLWQISNELIGDVWLLIFVGLIVTWYLTIKGKLGYKTGTILSVLWLSIIFAQTREIIIWTFVILFVGVIFYFIQARAIRKG